MCRSKKGAPRLLGGSELARNSATVSRRDSIIKAMLYNWEILFHPFLFPPSNPDLLLLPFKSRFPPSSFPLSSPPFCSKEGTLGFFGWGPEGEEREEERKEVSSFWALRDLHRIYWIRRKANSLSFSSVLPNTTQPHKDFFRPFFHFYLSRKRRKSDTLCDIAAFLRDFFTAPFAQAC